MADGKARAATRPAEAPGRGLSLEAQFAQACPGSQALYARACEVFPSGVTHDNRFLRPFPLYVSHAQGARKWDVDGHAYIDYWMGHGALLLGHNHPEVTRAVQAQLLKGTHYGAGHALEVAWGEWVQRLIPSAARVKFTSSGTEATLMAIRLARSYTGKKKIVKFEGHFHGWHDHVVAGVHPPYDVPVSPGLLAEIVGSTVLCPPNDVRALEQVLAQDRDIACVMVEPTGASFGTIPTRGEFLRELRRLTTAHEVLLIFDEVITGFRVAPGGAQAYYDVTPDLTTLAKILAGGLPGGAVAGRRDILAWLEFQDGEWNRFKKIAHPGTFNANPLSAAAGTAALPIVATGEAQRHANHLAHHLRVALNEVLARRGVNWCVYGEFSGLHVLMGYAPPAGGRFDAEAFRYDYRQLKRGDPTLQHAFRVAMILNGVDLPAGTAMTSAVHTEADVEATVKAFDRALELLHTQRLL
jgi:glutamate-1-semialdehyde 2,1-aminomutase